MKKLVAEMTIAEKRDVAEGIFQLIVDRHLGYNNGLYDVCQGDFKTLSLLAYKLAVDAFDDHQPPKITNDDLQMLLKLPTSNISIGLPVFMPAKYCGGNMEFGRLFAVNLCAFSSPDSIVGLRVDKKYPNECRVVKGLKHLGVQGTWNLFKLDPASSDDMTAMLYSSLEKDFYVEIAHFPHDSARRIVYSLKY